MEFLSIIGLAGNIFQFLEFSSGIISTSAEIYRSATGTSSQYADLDTAAAALESLAGPLQGSTSTADPELDRICTSCVECARRLQYAIGKLKLRGKSKRETLRKALLAVWKEDEINALSHCLAALRSQLTAHLMYTTKKDMDASFRQLGLDDEARAQALMQAFDNSQDTFGALLRAQNASVESLREEHKIIHRLQEQKSTDIMTVVQNNQLGIHKIQSDTGQLREENHQMKNKMIKMEAKEEELEKAVKRLEAALIIILKDKRKNEKEHETVVAQVSKAKNPRAKAKLKEKINALAAAIMAFQLMHENMMLLLRAIKNRTYEWMADAPAQMIFLKRLTAVSSKRPKSVNNRSRDRQSHLILRPRFGGWDVVSTTAPVAYSI